MSRFEFRDLRLLKVKKKPNDIPDKKRCTKCHKVKPLNEFHKMKIGKYGRYIYCKTCSKDYMQEYYRNKPKYTGQVTEKECIRCHKAFPVKLPLTIKLQEPFFIKIKVLQVKDPLFRLCPFLSMSGCQDLDKQYNKNAMF